MVDQARGEDYSVHAVEGTEKHSSILQFRSAHDDGDSKGTSDGRTSGCPATGDTAVASTRTPRAADEDQTNYSRFQAVVDDNGRLGLETVLGQVTDTAAT